MTESGAAAQVTEYKQVGGPRAWTAASVDDPVDWVTNLTEFSLLELESFVAETEAERVTETRITAQRPQKDGCCQGARSILDRHNHAWKQLKHQSIR